jgi:hypothetical protein
VAGKQPDLTDAQDGVAAAGEMEKLRHTQGLRAADGHSDDALRMGRPATETETRKKKRVSYLQAPGLIEETRE